MSEVQSHTPLANAPLHGVYSLVDLHSGRAYPLQPGLNSIGRSPKSHVQLDDGMVSRRHAVVMVYEEGSCEIGDTHSSNGVFLNGRKLRGTASLALGALLEISGNRLIFTRQNADAPAPPVFTDETLEVVVWNAPDACWHFGIILGVNQFAPATYSPTDDSPPSGSPAWETVRACCRQVRLRERSARALVRRDGNYDVHSACLNHVMFTNSNATLVYDLSLSEAVCVTLDPAGEFISGPLWIPAEMNHPY